MVPTAEDLAKGREVVAEVHRIWQGWVPHWRQLPIDGPERVVGHVNLFGLSMMPCRRSLPGALRAPREAHPETLSRRCLQTARLPWPLAHCPNRLADRHAPALFASK